MWMKMGNSIGENKMQIELSEIKSLKKYAQKVAECKGKGYENGIQVSHVLDTLEKEVKELKRHKTIIGHVLSSDDKTTTSEYMSSFMNKMVKVASEDAMKDDDE